MTRNHGIVTWARAVCLAVVGHFAAAAPVVDIATNLALDLSPGQSGSMTMSVQNNGDATADVNFYQFAVMLIPTSGTGTLTLDSWAPPASNPLVGDPTEYTPTETPTTQDLISPVTIEGTDYYAYYPLQAANTDATNWPLGVDVSKNVGTMTFTAGPAEDNTVSTWDVYVVSQSYESPAFPPTFFANAALAPSDFGNLLAVDGGLLKIGTVTVTAVPEPGSLTLAAVGAAFAAGAVIRRRRRAAA